MSRLPAWIRRLVGEAARFGLVGALAYVLDVAVFNGLRLSQWVFLSSPVPAKTAGMIVATVVAWLGSRYWAFRHTARDAAAREFVEFFVVATAGYVINIAVLFVSHYVLGFRSLLADNISGNLIGVALATAFRFVIYRSWVFHPSRTGRSRTIADSEGP